MDIKEKFYKVYSNLPLNIRDEIIVVIEGEPITWRVAKNEIDNDTEMLKIILKKLEELDII